MTDGTGAFRQTAIVADLAAARGIINLKRAALLFDSVVVLKTKEGETDRHVKAQPVVGIEAGELDWLIEQGLLSFVQDPSGDLMETHDSEKKEFETYRRSSFCNHLLLREDQTQGSIKSISSFVARYAALYPNIVTREVRLIPVAYEAEFGLDQMGITAARNPFEPERPLDYAITTAVILASIPIPDDLTPWESILEFRSERTNKVAFSNFRKYITKISSEATSIGELQDQVEADIFVVESALKRAKVKHHNEIVETTVVATVSVIENFLKLKWSEFVKPLFSVRKSQQEFLNAEAKIAENGIYYIVRANEAFGAYHSHR